MVLQMLGSRVKRPDGITQKLMDVLRNDPRFVVMGSAPNIMVEGAEVSPRGAPVRPAEVQAAAASAAHPRRPGNETSTVPATHKPYTRVQPQHNQNDLAEQWRCGMHAFLLSAGGPVVMQLLGSRVKRPDGIILKLMDVVKNDPRFIILGSAPNIMVEGAEVSPRGALARPAEVQAASASAATHLAEEWRRGLHAFLLSAGAPVVMQMLGSKVKRPEGLVQKLMEVVKDDPRFVVTGSAPNIMVESAEPPPRGALARPAEVAASPAYPRRPWKDACRFYMAHGYCGRGVLCFADHPPRDAAPAPRAAPPAGGWQDSAPAPLNPRRPGRELCERYVQTGECPFEDKCFFDHPPRDMLRGAGDGGGASRVEAPGEAPPVTHSTPD